MKRAESCVGTGGPIRQWSLSGPSLVTAPGRIPVRGDLAHIRLAGLHFVPHYAAPMPHRASFTGATIRAASNNEADALSWLEAGAHFAVLDIAGGWAWGQAEADDGSGPVGYVDLSELERIA